MSGSGEVERANEKLLPEAFREDVETLLDCFTGADGGADFVRLCGFLRICVTQGEDVKFLRELARLIRILGKRS